MQSRGTSRTNAQSSTLSFRELRLEEIVVRKHIHTACLSLLAIVAAGAVITYLRSVLVPFVLATMLFYSLAPIVDLLSIRPISAQPSPRARPLRTQSSEMNPRRRENSFDSTEFKGRSGSDAGSGPEWTQLGPVKKAVMDSLRFLNWLVRSRLPRPMAVVVALLLAVLVIAALMVVVFSSVNELVAHSDKYTERIHAMVDWTVKMGGSVGVTVSNQAIAEKLMLHTAFISELLLNGLRFTLEELTNGFLMLLFTVYLLLGYAPDERRQTGAVRAEIEMQVKRYIGYKVLLSASTGILVGASLLLLRVDLALVFGLLAFLLNFIPNVGSVISVCLPMPVVIFDPSKTWVDTWLAFLIPTVVHTITGNFIEPRVFGETMDLHPIVVLLSLMLWGSLWGVVGMCLAVPITAVIKICLQSLDHPLPRYLAGVLEGHLEVSESAVSGPSPATPTNSASGKQFLGLLGSGGGGVSEICLALDGRPDGGDGADRDPLLDPSLAGAGDSSQV